MRVMVLLAVVLATMFAVAGVYNKKRDDALAQAEARAAFVRDSTMREWQRRSDSARIATNERIRINTESSRAAHDSLARQRECIREQLRMRRQGTERVLNRCP